MSVQRKTVEIMIGDECQVEVRDAGGDYCQIPGGTSISYANGERPINSLNTFEGQKTRLGTKSKPTFTVNLGSFLPLDPIMKYINLALKEKERRHVRWTYPREELVGATEMDTTAISIASGGVVTLTGVSDDDKVILGSDAVAQGSVLILGPANALKTYYIVEKTLDADGKLATGGLKVVNADGSEVSSNVNAVNLASAVQGKDINGFFTPAIRFGPIICEVTSYGNQDASESQVGVSSSIGFSSIQELPEPRVV